MATLIFNDGREKKVSHNQAGVIREIMDGERLAKNEAEEKYVSQIKEVRFEPLKTRQESYASRYSQKEPDLIMRAIMQDPKIRGKAKFKAVAQRLKTRNQ